MSETQDKTVREKLLDALKAESDQFTTEELIDQLIADRRRAKLEAYDHRQDLDDLRRVTQEARRVLVDALGEVTLTWSLDSLVRGVVESHTKYRKSYTEARSALIDALGEALTDWSLEDLVKAIIDQRDSWQRVAREQDAKEQDAKDDGVAELLRKTVKSPADEILELHAEIERLKDEIERLKDEIERLKDRAASVPAVLKSQADELLELYAEIERLKDEIERLKDRAASVPAVLKSQADELLELYAEIERLKDCADSVPAVLNSTLTKTKADLGKKELERHQMQVERDEAVGVLREGVEILIPDSDPCSHRLCAFIRRARALVSGEVKPDPRDATLDEIGRVLLRAGAGGKDVVGSAHRVVEAHGEMRAEIATLRTQLARIRNILGVGDKEDLEDVARARMRDVARLPGEMNIGRIEVWNEVNNLLTELNTPHAGNVRDRIRLLAEEAARLKSMEATLTQERTREQKIQDRIDLDCNVQATESHLLLDEMNVPKPPLGVADCKRLQWRIREYSKLKKKKLDEMYRCDRQARRLFVMILNARGGAGWPGTIDWGAWDRECTTFLRDAVPEDRARLLIERAAKWMKGYFATPSRALECENRHALLDDLDAYLSPNKLDPGMGGGA